MFTMPASFHEFLSKNNCIDEIYDAINNDDLSEVVMTAMRALKTTQCLPPLNTVLKSEKVSEEQRNHGNCAFKNNNYQHALMFYNQAIQYAPINSRELKIAISNRSALFLKLKAYKACLIDIETCFAMGCPDEIIGKLKKRREDIIGSVASEDFTLILLNRSVDNYIKCNMASHPLIPCASKYVEIIGSVPPKVVASTDIKVGTVVSCEKAYVSHTNIVHSLFVCYYCQRHALNLTPCDNCCFVMFCDDVCKNQCYDEYHKYECLIMDVKKVICHTVLPNLMLKAVLKMKSKCKSWKELIEASYCIGFDRMKTSSIEEIYNCNNLFSVLNIKDDKPFIYGVLYNASFVCAALLHYLGQIPSFYPKDHNEKQQAMRALGRIMLFLSVYQSPLQLYQVIRNLSNRDEHTHIHNLPSFGLFSFTGKLKKSCKPNLSILNKNNELILIAIRTIKSGEELTISFQQHLLDSRFVRHKRNMYNFIYFGDVCDCSICTGYDSLNAKGQLSTFQKKYYVSLNFNGIDENLKSIHLSDVYNKLLQAMDVLGDVPHSHEYEELYKRFRRCTMFFEAIKGNNFILENII